MFSILPCLAKRAHTFVSVKHGRNGMCSVHVYKRIAGKMAGSVSLGTFGPRVFINERKAAMAVYAALA